MESNQLWAANDPVHISDYFPIRAHPQVFIPSLIVFTSTFSICKKTRNAPVNIPCPKPKKTLHLVGHVELWIQRTSPCTSFVTTTASLLKCLQALNVFLRDAATAFFSQPACVCVCVCHFLHQFAPKSNLNSERRLLHLSVRCVLFFFLFFVCTYLSRARISALFPGRLGNRGCSAKKASSPRALNLRVYLSFHLWEAF